MADKIKFLIQKKRTALITQIITLNNDLDKENMDSAILKFRMVRVSELYHALKDYNDQLAMLETNEAHRAAFERIQQRFYSLEMRVEMILNANNNRSKTSGSTSSDGTRYVSCCRPNLRQDSHSSKNKESSWWTINPFDTSYLTMMAAGYLASAVWRRT